MTRPNEPSAPPFDGWRRALTRWTPRPLTLSVADPDLVRWWAPLAVVLGYVAFVASGVIWPGCVVTTPCFTVLAVFWTGPPEPEWSRPDPFGREAAPGPVPGAASVRA